MDGSDPPFLLPVSGAGVLRNSHLRNTPWGVAPVPLIPAGRPLQRFLKTCCGPQRHPFPHVAQHGLGITIGYRCSYGTLQG